MNIRASLAKRNYCILCYDRWVYLAIRVTTILYAHRTHCPSSDKFLFPGAHWVNVMEIGGIVHCFGEQK